MSYPLRTIISTHMTVLIIAITYKSYPICTIIGTCMSVFNSQIQAYILLSVLIVFSNTQTAIINIISEVRTAYALMSYLFIVISIGDSSTYLLYTIIDIGYSCDSKNINLCTIISTNYISNSQNINLCTIISTNYISNSHLLLLWLLLPTRYVIPRSI